jgi:hypothetical protein
VLLGPMGLPSWWTTLKVMSHLWSVFLFPTRSNIDRIIRWALGDDPRVHGAFADFMRMGAKSWKSLRVAPPLNLSDDQLRKIISPVLLMLGEHDNVIGDAGEVSRRAKRLISNVRVEIIPEAGHMLSTEKSEFVNTANSCKNKERKNVKPNFCTTEKTETILGLGRSSGRGVGHCNFGSPVSMGGASASPDQPRSWAVGFGHVWSRALDSWNGQVVCRIVAETRAAYRVAPTVADHGRSRRIHRWSGNGFAHRILLFCILVVVGDRGDPFQYHVHCRLERCSLSEG